MAIDELIQHAHPKSKRKNIRVSLGYLVLARIKKNAMIFAMM
jgi:hypothetical protein